MSILENYNTKHICIYNSDEVFLVSDKISENEKKFVRDVLYRNDILYIFDLDEYDENIVNEMIFNLYKKLEQNKNFKNIIEIISNKFCVNPNEESLIILYSYDFLYLTHKCVSDLLENNEICKDSLNKLKSIIV